jgi:hypothetical protein
MFFTKKNLQFLSILLPLRRNNSKNLKQSTGTEQNKK